MNKPCECSNAGWCNRHQINKPYHLYELCKNREDYRQLWDDMSNEKPQTEKVIKPPEPTPMWVKLISKLKIAEDKGVGDTVQRYAAKLGGELFKEWSKKMGMPCGCTQRQNEWNKQYPYENNT